MLRAAIVGGLVILPAGMPLQRASINARKYDIYDAINSIALTAKFDDLEQQKVNEHGRLQALSCLFATSEWVFFEWFFLCWTALFVTAALLLQCILGDVLAHRINVSYDQFIGEVVSAVNGPLGD